MSTDSDVVASETGADDPQDVLAITLYSKTGTELGSEDYWKGFLDQKENIIRMKEGLEAAKQKLAPGSPPLKTELTLYLIPAWDKGETFDTPAYLARKVHMLKTARDTFDSTGVIVKDLLTETNISEAEKKFLKDLKSMGSTADLMKTRAIIDNQGNRCLQTDSNLEVVHKDYEELYRRTFLQDKDAFNASRCSIAYIAAHNKVIFLSDKSELPAFLAQKLIEYCTKYEVDPKHHESSLNGVYDFAFTPAMAEAKAVYTVVVNDTRNPGQKFRFYPADFRDPRYTLMFVVVPNQVESWRAVTGLIESEVDKMLRNMRINIDGIDYGASHFRSIAKVFTNVPRWHRSTELGPDGKPTNELLRNDDGSLMYPGADQSFDIFTAAQNVAIKSVLKSILVGFADEISRITKDDPKAMKTALQTLVDKIDDNDAARQLIIDVFGDLSAESIHHPKHKDKLVELFRKHPDHIAALVKILAAADAIDNPESVREALLSLHSKPTTVQTLKPQQSLESKDPLADVLSTPRSESAVDLVVFPRESDSSPSGDDSSTSISKGRRRQK